MKISVATVPEDGRDGLCSTPVTVPSRRARTTTLSEASDLVTSLVSTVAVRPAATCSSTTGARSALKTWSAEQTTSVRAPNVSMSADIRSSRSPLPCAKPLSVAGPVPVCGTIRRKPPRLRSRLHGRPPARYSSIEVTWYSSDTQTSARSACSSPDRAKSISRCTPP